MKKNGILIKILVVLLLFVPINFMYPGSFSWGQEEPEKTPLDLDDTQWEVEMVFINAKGKKITETDKLIFADKKFISEAYEKKGFKPTNYSLTVETDGSTKFGTMQVKEKETTFWKGIIRENMVDGSVHTQRLKGENSTTYFTGKLTDGIVAPLGTKVKTPPPPPVENLTLEEGTVTDPPVQGDAGQPNVSDVPPEPSGN